MSDTSNTVDTAPNAGNPSEAAPPSASDPQGSAPAPDVTSAPPSAQPEGDQPDKQSRREARAYANLRRENRDLYRRLGGMEAMLAQMQQSHTPPAAEGDQEPRQARAPAPADTEAQGDLNRSIIERIEDAGEEFEAVVETITARGFPISTAMRDYLATSERPHDVAKALADDPKEARRISLLGERAADRAMERLEAKSSAKPAPKTTKAPPPVPTVGGRSTPEFDPHKSSMDDYAKHWAARQAAKRA